MKQKYRRGVTGIFSVLERRPEVPQLRVNRVGMVYDPFDLGPYCRTCVTHVRREFSRIAPIQIASRMWSSIPIDPLHILPVGGVVAFSRRIKPVPQIWSMFPLIFKVQEVSNKKASLYTQPGESKTTYREVSDDEKVTRFWCLAGFIAFFGWGSIVLNKFSVWQK